MRLNSWILCSAVVFSFAAGAMVANRLAWPGRAQAAQGDRVFELMIYHTMPDKVPALESVFRDVSKLQTKHHLNVIGYWVPKDDPAWKNTFVYLIAHPSKEQADANWKALHADPAFLPYRKAAEPLVEKVNGEFHVDQVFMRPTDYSAMK